MSQQNQPRLDSTAQQRSTINQPQAQASEASTNRIIMASFQPTATLQESILGFLQGCKDPQPSLAISKKVGKITAKEVNPTLYRLEKEGKIVKTTPSGSKPFWKIAGTVIPSDDLPTTRSRARDDQQSANSYTIPPQGSQAGIGDEKLYRRTDFEDGVTFHAVNRPTNNTPTFVPVPVNESVGGPQPVTPHSIQESSIANPSATPQQASEGRPSRPVQIEVDDRFQQATDPVTPPNPINFAGRGKEMQKDEKSKAKNIENQVSINTMNNSETETIESPPSSRSPSAVTLDSNSGESIEPVSLSSLTIEPSGSNMPPSEATSSSDIPPSEATPSSDMPPSEAIPSSAGGPRGSKAKMAIRFPGKPKDEDPHTSQ